MSGGQNLIWAPTEKQWCSWDAPSLIWITLLSFFCISRKIGFLWSPDVTEHNGSTAQASTDSVATVEGQILNQKGQVSGHFHTTTHKHAKHTQPLNVKRNAFILEIIRKSHRQRRPFSYWCMLVQIYGTHEIRMHFILGTSQGEGLQLMATAHISYVEDFRFNPRHFHLFRFIICPSPQTRGPKAKHSQSWQRPLKTYPTISHQIILKHSPYKTLKLPTIRQLKLL